MFFNLAFFFYKEKNMVIAIIMLLAICVALIIALCQKVSIDKETKKENEEMALINARLKDKNKNLANENKYYTLEIKHKSDTKDALEKDGIKLKLLYFFFISLSASNFLDHFKINKNLFTNQILKFIFHNIKSPPAFSTI